MKFGLGGGLEGQQDELRKRNWASIECDLLDNYHTRKRFASNVRTAVRGNALN